MGKELRRLSGLAFLCALTAVAGCRADLRPALARWATSNAMPLRTTDPAAGLDDLGWVHELAANSRVVGMGEATHGTREFFRMKHRLFRDLVEREGFRTFAIEANLPEVEAINRYVLSGVGDPATALAGLHFWTWDTVEVRDLIEWMRAWNRDPGHAPVNFYGFDCQFTGAAARGILGYLNVVEPGTVPRFSRSLAFLVNDSPLAPRWPEARVDHLLEDLATLDALFDSRHEAWARARGERKWQTMRRWVVVLRQATELHGPKGNSRMRDRFMADNVRWILEREGGKVALWAHNAHVARAPGDMGGFLASELGAGYRVIGFAFGHGTFRAHDGASSAVVKVTVSSAGGGDFDQALADVPLPLFALLTSRAPSPLDRRMSFREFGAVYAPGTRMRRPLREFDAMIFVRETTAARPSPTGVRPGRTNRSGG